MPYKEYSDQDTICRLVTNAISMSGPHAYIIHYQMSTVGTIIMIIDTPEPLAYIRESVDSLCRDGADAQYMHYLSKSRITSPQTC